MDRKEAALELYKNGYNCAQAVACAYSNIMGVDPMTTFKAAEAFGFGMGDMNGPCGACSGACMVAGMKRSDGDMENAGGSKRACYNLIAPMKNEFIERAGGLTCKEIKTKEGGQKTSCKECISIACEICDKYLLGIYPDGEEPNIKVIRNENAKF